MFRNVLNGYVRKAFDYLKIENDQSDDNNNNNNSTNFTTTTTAATNTTNSSTHQGVGQSQTVENAANFHYRNRALTSSFSLSTVAGNNQSTSSPSPSSKDVNNNNLAAIIRERHHQQGGYSPNSAVVSSSSRSQQQQQHQQQLHQQFNIFRRTTTTPTNARSFESHHRSQHKAFDHRTSSHSRQASLIDEYDWFRPFKQQHQWGDDGESLLDASGQASDRNHPDIKFESYYDYLTKFYSANNNMANKTKTLDEYFAGNEIDYDLAEPDSLQPNLRACRLFQKSYYREMIRGEQVAVPSWRMKEKMKTVSAALVLCLNIGVDPPDVAKPPHCSKLECWINQMVATPQKALEMIGAELQKQYERWQPRARYKHSLDPTTDDVKKLCISLRKNAKEDRVLFHYNGHGVPKPTVNGEIWVFNKEFTQYIPLSLYEVQTWMGTPSLYVWDCSSAGLIIQSFLQFEEDRENELLQRNESLLNGTGSPRNSTHLNTGDPAISGNPAHMNGMVGGASGSLPPTIPGLPKLRDSIHLAACSANEILPMQSPDLPYDIFTACLTTPIKAALHWYVSQRMGTSTLGGNGNGPQVKQIIPGLTMEMLDRIPGQINDRRTMMGELNWIFTAITDTIAWNVLDSDMFQKLFRQDLLVASLFRNFLLAERIMKSLDCNPVSHPPLPATNEHPLWQAWDLALDMCISQLPGMLLNGNDASQQPREFVSCGFFTEQIEIFDAWLKFNVNSSSCPEQLPVVLQVLLSVHHRLKALELLAKFIDMGPWAVSAALSVGIFPYVLKLLSTQPKELRSLLTFIWAKILAVDRSCQAELVKDNGHAYFIHILPEQDVPPIQKVYSAFVLSCLVDNYPTGQESAKQNHLIAICSYILGDKQSRDYASPLLRQWVCICLGLSWQNYPEARWEGVRCNAHQSLIGLINDPVAEVRAAAIFALGTYICSGHCSEATVEHTNKIHAEIVSSLIKEYDMVYIVRKELVVALFSYINQFVSQHHPQSQPQPQQQAPTHHHINGMTPTSGAGNSSLQPTPTTTAATTPQIGSPLSSQDLSRHSSSNSLNPGLSTPSTPNHSSSDTNTQANNNSTSSLIRSASSGSALNQQQKQQQSSQALERISESSTGQQRATMSSNQAIVQQNPPLTNLTSSTSDYSSGMSLSISGSSNLPRSTSTISNSTTSTATIAATTATTTSTANNSSLLANNSVNNLFVRVWNLIIEMQSDPHPEVAELAQRVFNYFYGQLSLFDISKQKIINDLIKIKQLPKKNAVAASSSLDKSAQAISTEFVPWCCKYFLRPLLSAKTVPAAASASASAPQDNEILETCSKVDLYSAEILDQHCKLLYNQKRRKNPPAWLEPKEMDDMCQMKHASLPIHVKFHPTEDNLIFVVDRDAQISVYETQTRTKSLQFSLLKYQQHMLNARKNLLVTSFKIVNAQHEPVLLVGTEDYVVRFVKPDLVGFRAANTQLLTAFNAISENSKKPSTKESGLIVEWDEQREQLMCGGDTNFIRVWDMNKELYKEYPTEATSGITTMTTSDHYTVVGFGDGSLRLFDFRAPPAAAAQRPSFGRANQSRLMPPFFQHESYVLKAKLHNNSPKLVSVGIYGGVNVFDMRMLKSEVETLFNREYISAAECHPVNELIAVGTGTDPNQSIKIYDYRGRELSQIKYHDGFMGKRIAATYCIDWSSNKNEIVFGGNDNCLNVFSCRDVAV